MTVRPQTLAGSGRSSLLLAHRILLRLCDLLLYLHAVPFPTVLSHLLKETFNTDIDKDVTTPIKCLKLGCDTLTMSFTNSHSITINHNIQQKPPEVFLKIFYLKKTKSKTEKG